MAVLWVSKRSGRRARGGGCIGCIPFGCLTGLLVTAALALLLMG